MIRSLLLTAFVFTGLTALPALAQEHEGMWIGSGEGDLSVDLSHIQEDQYGISISTTVPISDDFTGCGGGIDGEVLLDSKGGNFFVENEDYDASLGENPMNMRYCEISLKFDEKGMLIIEEKDGCLAYHGASCGFTGTLEHEAAGI